MSVHHSNPTCDTCGCRHSAGHVSECLDCMLASSSEKLSEARAEIERLTGEVEQLKGELQHSLELFVDSFSTNPHWLSIWKQKCKNLGPSWTGRRRAVESFVASSTWPAPRQRPHYHAHPYAAG